MWIHILAVILCLGFSTVAVLGIAAIDKQQDISVPSRYGHKTNTLEILYVNAGLLLAAYFIYIKYYTFMPALIAFVIAVIITTRISSGLGSTGVFIGMTNLEWNKINSYKIINDDINTLQVKIRANKRQYILRCDKTYRQAIEKLFQENQVPITLTKNENEFTERK